MKYDPICLWWFTSSMGTTRMWTNWIKLDLLLRPKTPGCIDHPTCVYNDLNYKWLYVSKRCNSCAYPFFLNDFLFEASVDCAVLLAQWAFWVSIFSFWCLFFRDTSSLAWCLHILVNSRVCFKTSMPTGSNFTSISKSNYQIGYHPISWISMR